MTGLGINLEQTLEKINAGPREQEHDTRKLFSGIKLNKTCSTNKPNSGIIDVDTLADKSNCFTSPSCREPADGLVAAEFGSWRNYAKPTPYLYRYFKKSLVRIWNHFKLSITEGSPCKGQEMVFSHTPLFKAKVSSVRYKLEVVLKDCSTRASLGEFRSLTLFGDLYPKITRIVSFLNRKGINNGEIMNHINQQLINIKRTFVTSFFSSPLKDLKEIFLESYQCLMKDRILSLGLDNIFGNLFKSLKEEFLKIDMNLLKSIFAPALNSLGFDKIFRNR